MLVCKGSCVILQGGPLWQEKVTLVLILLFFNLNQIWFNRIKKYKNMEPRVFTR